MGDASDDYEAFVVVDGVHNPVVADSNSIVITAGELGGSYWAGIAGESIDGSCDAIVDRIVKPPIGPCRLRMEANLVPALGYAAYVRTSDHGMAESRSSRACRAARLSSR